MRRFVYGSFALLSAGVLAASCFVPGFDLADTTGTGGSTSSAGSGGDGGAGGEGACQKARWPDPPASSDPGGDDVTFVVAMRSLDFGEDTLGPNEGAAVGYDVDDLCTCPDVGSCKPPEGQGETIRCDGPGGRDNSMARLIAFASGSLPQLSSESLTQEAEMGNGTVLVRVADWNGQPNDVQITVTIYPSPGTDLDYCNVPRAPLWNGEDRWSVDITALEPPENGGGGMAGSPPSGGGGGAGGAGGGGGAGGSDPPTDVCNSLLGYDVDKPRYFDDNAYVSGGVLVAGLPEAGLILSLDNPVTLPLRQGFISARIEQEGGLWSLREGVLVGRIEQHDFLGVVGHVSTGGDPICTDSFAYGTAKDIICGYRDIVAEGLGGPTKICDATSFGLEFEGFEAILGAAVDDSSSGALCPPATDPANDSCEER